MLGRFELAIVLLFYSVFFKCCDCQCSPKSVPITSDETPSNAEVNEGLRSNSEASKQCLYGDCVVGKCECHHGWKGPFCDACNGRVLKTEDSGFIFDGPKNYSAASECSWLIQPKSTHSTIKLQFHEFASECGWDYLYVFDGDSAYSPLLASLNGIIMIAGNEKYTRNYPDIIATSGSVFLYFFSDAAYVMVGFNISYSIDSCQKNCSGNGHCQSTFDGQFACKCNEGWFGEACDTQLCACDGTSNNSCAVQGKIDEACVISSEEGYWVEILTNETHLGSASHTSVFYNSRMYIFGGLQFRNFSNNMQSVSYYDPAIGDWRYVITTGAKPTERYGHSTVLLDSTVILFGGREVKNRKLSSELWKLNLETNEWTQVTYTKNFTTVKDKDPLTLWGHSATLIKSKDDENVMVVMFGYHTELEYSGFVYEYNINTNIWTRPLTYGFAIKPSFAHTAVWDSSSRLIYLYGGYRLLVSTTKAYGMSNHLYSYQPDSRTFKLLKHGEMSRYLHSSIFPDGLMYVYGGSTHNDTDESLGALCYSSSFAVYDPTCGSWRNLQSPGEKETDFSRYGHSLAHDGRNIFAFGGYDGTMLSSIVAYHPIMCSSITDQSSCISGSRCEWINGNCSNSTKCPVNNEAKSCSSLSCSDCISTYHNCVFCNNECKETCPGGQTKISDPQSCPDVLLPHCSGLMNSLQCLSVAECHWNRTTGACEPGPPEKNATVTAEPTCGFYNTCGNCTKQKLCMWCGNRNECVATNSYVIQYPYGECRKWARHDCSMALQCKDYKSCSDCNVDPSCGWCDDGSGTGTGTCTEGGYRGPVDSNDTSLTYFPLDSGKCSMDRWNFVGCPLCQCSGHSTCLKNNSKCIECANNTSGDQCEFCKDGYFGDSRNGGTCEPCFCNNHGNSCDNKSGTCQCDTKGIIGETCDRCDVSEKYFGDPKNNGTCFYNLLINYSFTFTLNQNRDKYVKAINYDNSPPFTSDVDLSFDSETSSNVRLTIAQTWKNASRKKRDIIEERDVEKPWDSGEVTEIELDKFIGIKTLRYQFSGEKYKFGNEEVRSTIRIYVNNFTYPNKITISLVQQNGNLLLLLLVLFSVFLVLLLITAVVWKLKLVYDNYTRQRQRREELEQMAARPFSAVHLDCDEFLNGDKDASNLQLLPNEKHQPPSAITEEVCVQDQARIVSVFLWMPFGDPEEESKSYSSRISHGGRRNNLMIGSTLLKSSGVTGHKSSAQSSQKTKKLTDRLRVVFKPGDSATHATARNENANNNSETTQRSIVTRNHKTESSSTPSVGDNSRSDECVTVQTMHSKPAAPAYDNPAMNNV